MRYDAVDHVARWAQLGRWPQIHTRLVDLVEQTAEDGAVLLDLCSSTGLLGQQLVDRAGLDVVAIEADGGAIEVGRAHGITVSTVQMTLHPGSLDGFADVVRSHGVTGIVARRCLPELFATDFAGRNLSTVNRPFARAWLDLIHSLGVDTLWIEGRARTVDATNPLATIGAEIELVSSHYFVVDREGPCARLTRRATIEP